MTARWYRISGTAPVCGWCLAEAVVIVAASLRCRPVCVNTSKKECGLHRNADEKNTTADHLSKLAGEFAASE